jgi:hypothetical protein
MTLALNGMMPTQAPVEITTVKLSPLPIFAVPAPELEEKMLQSQRIHQLLSMMIALTTIHLLIHMMILALNGMMPTQILVETMIPKTSSPLTFAALAMEVAPEAILEATAMEMALVTELATAQELDTDMVQDLLQDLKLSYMMVAPMTIH